MTEGFFRLLRRVALIAALMLAASCSSVPDGAFISPVEGTITSNFGPRGRGYHYGVDIAAKRGTPVVASQGGKVVFRGRKKRFGRMIIIDHGGGVQTYYAHLSGYNVRQGRRVKRGQKIGRVGKSGRASGYHLHFEFRVNGKPQNPRGVVPI